MHLAPRRSTRHSLAPLLAATLSLASIAGVAPAGSAIDPAIIGATSTSTYICPTNTCVTLPVTISRTDNTPLLGFSVTFQLSGNLSLCSGTASITEGTFLSSAGSTTFLVTDNGGGSYKADGVVLGDDCGPTATSGTLFNVGVTSADPGGTGSITVTSVILRDCDNGPVPAAAGAPGTVPIDNQAPTASLTSPNGGESWRVGTSQTITWTAGDNGGIAGVDLAYSSDGGATYPNVIATGLASSGSYAWTVPNSVTTQARVRVTAHDLGCSSAADASDADFTIRDPIITASAGAGGSITPRGSVSAPYGTDQKFSIAPDKCHVIADVVVDGVSQGPVASYTFVNVTTDHTISASFSPLGPYTITATSGPGGNISPSGAISVPCGGGAVFTMTPDPHGHVADVTVDGSSVGAVTTYTFTDVQANHTIHATFAIDEFTLNVTVVGNGSVDKDPDQPSYTHGTIVQLTATPAAGWVFVNWTGNATSTSNPVNVLMDDNKTVTAHFSDVQVPAVHVIYPNGGETLLVGSTQKLEWTAADNSGTVQEVDLYLTRDNGATFTTIALDVPNTGSHLWTVTPPGTNVDENPVYSCRLFVSVLDPAFNKGADQSDGLFAIHEGPVADVTLESSALPKHFGLSAVWPNPVRAEGMHLQFAIAREVPVRLSVLDVQGREVQMLAQGSYRPGRYHVKWDGGTRGTTSGGVYFIRFITPDRTFTTRFVVAR